MVAFHDLRAIGLSDDFSVPNGLDHGDYPTFHRILLYAQSNLVLPPSEIKSELELAPRECADCVNRPWYRCILVPGQVVLADCSVPEAAYGVYTRISSYADWIKQVVPDVLSEPMTEVKR